LLYNLFQNQAYLSLLLWFYYEKIGLQCTLTNCHEIEQG